ncbi:PREDICTED: sentrin-specific protease 1-like [Cyprinodon variegatus]|uniref:SUMO specific peptidase 1 n=1 Tax=Cyprinodon variegatus TaxID=28743 RepID=A0A3Q2CXZ2_CYPVA|nr:PREDICTED: sentrin-specific protease 1-like [Cyprinodon variegatus]
MLNKIYEWIETSFANLRNGEPAVEHTPRHPAPRDALIRRKRTIDCLEEDQNTNEENLAIKKTRMGDFIDSVRSAAEGVKTHSNNVATWMRRNVSPALRNMLPTSSDSPLEEPQPSTSAASRPIVHRNSLGETFAAPSTTLEWKTPRSEWLRNERMIMGSKVCRRQVCMTPAHREVPKTNGHPNSVPSSINTKLHPSPRLGRPLNLRPLSASSFSGGVGTTSSSCSNMYEKTFPIKAVQSPTHSTSSSRLNRVGYHCTAQESVREEEKEIYRQLLTMVSGGQSSFLQNGSTHTFVRSHRDFTSFLTSHRRLQMASPAGSAAGGTSEGPSSPPSLRGISSQNSSNLPSPVGPSSKSETQIWSPDTDLGSGQTTVIFSAPSPSALQDGTSQGTESSAHDGDSVIIVNEQKCKKQNISSVPLFQAELWIKELTSMYDSRARERRRQIEEQEALASQLQRQRLSEEGKLSPDVEVHVRVPLEKEVPLTPVIEESKSVEEKPEFPDLTEEMEAEVHRVLMKGGNPHEVLSEGFGLSLTRKDLQTLSNLNWLNDEVINFYMNLLVERSKQPNLPSVNTFNTFFYPKLRSSGYSAVRRWTKKMDIFAKDILLVPVHLGMHWCLSVVDFRKKCVLYFDSMGGSNNEACKMLFDYLQQESRDKKGRELDTSGWTLHSKKPSEIPQQMNGSDCGMFTCKYADYITKDKPITFTQKHMPYFRRRMVWEIVNHKLL